MKVTTKKLRLIFEKVEKGGINVLDRASPIAKMKSSEVREYVNMLASDGYLEFNRIKPHMTSRITEKGKYLQAIVKDMELLREMRPLIKNAGELDCNAIVAAADYTKVVLLKR